TSSPETRPQSAGRLTPGRQSRSAVRVDQNRLLRPAGGVAWRRRCHSWPLPRGFAMPAKPSLRDRFSRAFRRRRTSPVRTPPALRRQLERLEDRAVPAVSLNSQFTGLPIGQSGDFVPPDTCGAAGSGNTYVETVNQEIAL